MRTRNSDYSISHSSRECCFILGFHILLSSNSMSAFSYSIMVWELIPEYIFPLLTGFSIFCLANQSSPDFTRVFGGTDGNEGLGLLSICFDWQYISGGVNPFTIPLQAQFSNLLGYLLCMVVFCGVYYNNIWKSRNFPFVRLPHLSFSVHSDICCAALSRVILRERYSI